MAGIGTTIRTATRSMSTVRAWCVAFLKRDPLPYHQTNFYSWVDGKTEVRDFPAQYRDGRMWFDNEVIEGWAAEVPLDTFNRTVMLYWKRKGDPDLYLYEMIQLSDDGNHRHRVWHWCLALVFGIGIARVKLSAGLSLTKLAHRIRGKGLRAIHLPETRFQPRVWGYRRCPRRLARCLFVAYLMFIYKRAQPPQRGHFLRARQMQHIIGIGGAGMVWAHTELAHHHQAGRFNPRQQAVTRAQTQVLG